MVSIERIASAIADAANVTVTDQGFELAPPPLFEARERLLAGMECTRRGDGAMSKLSDALDTVLGKGRWKGSREEPKDLAITEEDHEAARLVRENREQELSRLVKEFDEAIEKAKEDLSEMADYFGGTEAHGWAMAMRDRLERVERDRAIMWKVRDVRHAGK